MGGRATSGLQGEHGQVGSAPDWLGGLDLSASRCQHSGQSRSVCTYVPALCCSRGRNPGENGPERSRTSGDHRKSTQREDSERTCVIV